MPNYSYTAQNMAGEIKTGTLKAKDTNQLSQALREEGLILIKAEIQKESSVLAEKGLSFFNFGPSHTERMFFTRNLQVMISAGLSLPRALDTLANQTKNKKFKAALIGVRDMVNKGKSFSESLASYPDIFSELFHNIIRVGEEGGTMEEGLKTLTLQMEREHDLRSKIQGALIYPSVIVFAMIGIAILMLVTVIPQLNKTFQELKIELPWTTQLVISISNFLITKWYLAIIFIVLFSIFYWRATKTEKGKKVIDMLILKIPVISAIIKDANLAQVIRTLSSLINAGISLPRSLEITSRTIGNIHYRISLLQATDSVRKGSKLSDSLKPFEKLYSETMIQMFSVGEETGETTTILKKMADFYEEQVTDAAKNLTSIIEPVLMLAIGGAVGFFAVSMIQPLYSMLGAIE